MAGFPPLEDGPGTELGECERSLTQLLPYVVCMILFVLPHVDDLRVMCMVLCGVVYRLHQIVLGQYAVIQFNTVYIPYSLQNMLS